MIRSLITNPDEFMRRLSRRPGIRREFLLVLLFGVLGAIGNAYIGQELQSAMDITAIRFQVIGFAIDPVLDLLGIWLIYSLGSHYLADSFYRGRSPPMKVMKVAAWALFPLGLAYGVRSAVVWFIMQDTTIDELVGDEQAGIEEAFDLVTEGVFLDPLFVVALIAVVAGIAASGYWLMLGIQHVKDLDREQALRVVGVLVVLHIAYVVWRRSDLLFNLA